MVAKAVAFMEAHLDGPVKIADVVEALHVSHRSLERAFQANIGRTMRDELKRLRLVRAQTLLRTTRLPIEAIAEACGCPGGKALYRLFRTQHGLSPSTWRRIAAPPGGHLTG